MFQGAITAMITPFADGRVDEARLRANVETQIEKGIDGLVPCGTTGESPTLSHDEHNKVIDIVIDAVGGRVPVIAGTGSNATDEALDMTRHAAESGATASLQVSPYYNKPTQEGLYRHFMAIADDVELPMVLYNIPGRCGVALSIATIQRLAQHPNIVAIKEATGSLDLASEISATTDLDILSGDDSLTLPLMSVGGKGVISVASNIIPDRVAELAHLALEGRWDEARDRHLKLFELFKGLFIETNPVPVKTAAHLMGFDTGQMRLPMCEMSETNLAALKTLLQKHGLLSAAASA
ncbi:4-hydroxy-tetrahydrodipicolinate synthase [Planctomycetales bacterium ZRK34]|nr:4-hydroxy-tetrahydrodipicolinate synthase [Planctomycetales bacterium ZRK34]